MRGAANVAGCHFLNYVPPAASCRGRTRWQRDGCSTLLLTVYVCHCSRHGLFASGHRLLPVLRASYFGQHGSSRVLGHRLSVRVRRRRPLPLQVTPVYTHDASQHVVVAACLPPIPPSDRQCALDLQSALQDQIRYWNRHIRFGSASGSDADSGDLPRRNSMSQQSSAPSSLCLPEGESIRISLGGFRDGTPTSATSTTVKRADSGVAVTPSAGGFSGLRPPPSASSSIRKIGEGGVAALPTPTAAASAAGATTPSVHTGAAVGTVTPALTPAAAPLSASVSPVNLGSETSPTNSAAPVEDDEWGDFQSA